MKKVNLLSKAEMKKVMGGYADPCEGKTDLALKECRYQVCMSGWESSTHTPQENKDKLDGCYAAAGLPG